MDLGLADLIKTAFIIGTPIATLVWHLYKKLEQRQDHADKRITETEKTIIEIRAEFKYISRDIKEIKEMLQKVVK